MKMRSKAVVFLLVGCMCMLGTALVVAQQPPAKEKEAEIKKLQDEIKKLKNKREQELQEIEKAEGRERDKTIADYERFLAVYKDSPKRPDILFQLSRAYFEKEEAGYNKNMAAFEEKLAAFGRGEAKQKPDEPQKDYALTIRTYKQLMDESPNFDMLDAVLYTLGYCYKEMKQNEEMFVTYNELAEKFPKSKYAFEAQFHIGEYLFEQHQFQQAIEHYKKVVAAPTRVNFEKAIYKMGWCYYKMSDYPNAIEKFVGLVDKADVTSDLREESVTYIAISFSEYGGAERCLEYFKSIGGKPYEVEVLHRLGDIFKREDKLEEAIQTYDRFLTAYPTYKKAPQVQSNIVDCLRIMKLYEKANQQREALIDAYKTGSAWYNANTDPRERGEAIDITEKVLNENVLYYFLEAEKQGNKDLYTKAVDRSRKYLGLFPDGKNAYELNYLLAECLYKLERYEEAVVEYDKIAQNKSQEKYGEVSAYNVVKCYEQVDNRSAVKDQKETLTPLKQKMLAAIVAFEQSYPTSKSAPELLYMKGGIYFRMDDNNQARDAYKKIWEQFPQEQLASRAARMIAISYNKEKDFINAELWFGYVINSQNVDKKDLEEAKRMRAAAAYEQGAALRKEKKNLEAAVVYKRVAESYPESEFADKALSDAGACYEDDQQWDQAAVTYELMAGRYPNSLLAVAALGRAAACHEKNNNFDAAIRDYELISAKYPNAKEAGGALYTAGLQSEKMGFWQRAIDNYALLQQKYPTSEYTADAVFSIALCYEKLNNSEMAINYFKSFGERYKAAKPSMAVDALSRAGEGYFKNGNYTLAKSMFQQTISSYGEIMESGGQVEDAFPAKAQFYLGEIVYQQFDAIEFKQPQKEMQRSQNEKATLLKSAIGLYTESFKFAITEWATRSMYKIGLAFEAFGNTLYQQELPSRISEADKIVAQIKIREQVPNLYNQAHSYYKKNIEFGKSQNLTGNEWVTKSQERATATLYRIGEMYEEIAGLFRGAPIPGEFSKEEKEMYLAELQKQAVEREDVAVEIYKNALVWAVETQLQNEWTDRLKNRLNTLAPGVADEIAAGMVKAGAGAKNINDLVKGKKLDEIIDETGKEVAKSMTDDDWAAEVKKEEEAVATLKSELARVNETIAQVKQEIAELRK